MNAGLAKALGVMMKLDFERAVSIAFPRWKRIPSSTSGRLLFLCDEYQHFATVGESDPTGDEKFFSLVAPAQVHPDHRHPEHQLAQISAPRRELADASHRRSAPKSSSRCRMISPRGRRASFADAEDQLKVNYSLSESGHDTKVSWLTGKALSHKANIVDFQELQHPQRLPFRHEDVHGTAQRTIDHHRLRWDQPNAADVLLPEALLQRPEPLVFQANSPKGDL